MEEFRVFRAIGLAFKSWFKNFIPFTLLTALLYSPVLIYIETYKPKAGDEIETIQHIVLYPIYIVAALAALLPPMLTYRVIQELNGKKVSFLTSIKFGFRGVLPALIIAAVSFVLGLIPVPLVPAIISIVLSCMWFVAAPSAVAEKLNPISALSRSAELTRGRRWGIFGMTFLIGIVQAIILMAYVMPLASKHTDTPESFIHLVRNAAVVCFAIVGVFQMFNGIVQAVSYALLRSDKDGMSHEQLAAVFE